ncbi:MAG TPA: phosphatase PAP2 family protein [Chitinophagaceae bacterium]|nr:phosphatase PAP2 family protein [Chitinophagaceae bacterium]
MSQAEYVFKRFSPAAIIAAPAASLSYLAISAVLVGFKTDQLTLILVFNSFYFASAFSRKFILGFLIFIVYWIVFDYMKAFPNYRFNTMHIGDLYGLEKKYFGIQNGAALFTPNEFLNLFQHPFLDALSGIFYLCWVPVPLFFAAYLFLKNKEQFLKFSLTFFWVNILGFVIYYLYPAAPPWYIQHFGDVFYPNTPGNTAGLQRFDDLFHVSVFQSLYSKSSNVFAAMPSLHAAYPLIVIYYGIKNKMGAINFLFVLIALGIWFSAVYSFHHYVLDVVAGVVCCVIGIILFNRIVKLKPVETFLERYLKLIM